LKNYNFDSNDSDDYLMLSGIQHYSFCERQWALIHIEKQWADNVRTYGGHKMHENADNPFFIESRGDTVISRSIPLISHSLKIYGIADVIEFRRSDIGVNLLGRAGNWLPIPVEYKYGQKKETNCDEVQLCAQAICLEEMLSLNIPKGYLYYGKSRHREEVVFTSNLRSNVDKIVEDMWELYAKGVTPKAQLKKNCKNCSLYNICLPKISDKKKSAVKYLFRAVEEE